MLASAGIRVTRSPVSEAAVAHTSPATLMTNN
jgi:hypothetical protein